MTGVRVERPWSERVAKATQAALVPLADAERAVPMARYMKDVAPFLGISAAERRRATRVAWQVLDAPGSRDLGEAAAVLMAMPEREYHYSAYDLIERYRDQADPCFVRAHVTTLLTTKPWWDTVDGLVTAAVSPLLRRYPDDPLIEEWSESADRWLIRAAVTHQRGWGAGTVVSRVLHLCARHWDDTEFFVAKAIGWALRDIAAIDATAVAQFLQDREASGVVNRVATREATKGLERERLRAAT